jgi:hypothetical protein
LGVALQSARDPLLEPSEAPLHQIETLAHRRKLWAEALVEHLGLGSSTATTASRRALMSSGLSVLGMMRTSANDSKRLAAGPSRPIPWQPPLACLIACRASGTRHQHRNGTARIV